MNKKLVVIGTGLIGSSFSLAARNGLFDHIIGIEPDDLRARTALSMNIVDEIAVSVDEDADAVLIATPSDIIAEWVARLKDHPGIVFDVGSVKSAILESLQDDLGVVPARFVPCHPIAGSERDGPRAADAQLFAEQNVVITPHPTVDEAALAEVESWWRHLGARVEHLDASVHDRMFALTSHLPHFVAFAYLQQVDEEHLAFAGSGFRDFTRIGASDATLWSAIFEMNKSPLFAALDGLENSLREFREAMESDDLESIQAFIRTAQAKRQELDSWT